MVQYTANLTEGLALGEWSAGTWTIRDPADNSVVFRGLSERPCKFASAADAYTTWMSQYGLVGASVAMSSNNTEITAYDAKFILVDGGASSVMFFNNGYGFSLYKTVTKVADAIAVGGTSDWWRTGNYSAIPTTFPVFSLGLAITTDWDQYIMGLVCGKNGTDLVGKYTIGNGSGSVKYNVAFHIRQTFIEMVIDCNPALFNTYQPMLVATTYNEATGALGESKQVLVSLTSLQYIASDDLGGLRGLAAEQLRLAGTPDPTWTAHTAVASALKLTDQSIASAAAVAVEALELGDAGAAVRALLAAESLTLGAAAEVLGRYHASAAEVARLLEAIKLCYPVGLSEPAVFGAAVASTRALTVYEALRIADAGGAVGRYGVAALETIAATDALRRFLGCSALEGLTFADVVRYGGQLEVAAVEVLGLAETLGHSLIVRAVAAEALELTAEQVVQAIFNGELAETVSFEVAYVSPDGGFTTWAINTRTGAVTEYANYSFNSFAHLGNKFLGASDDGLFELNGDDDAGADITAVVRSGYAQFSGTHLGSIVGAYLGVSRGSGAYFLKVETLDGKSYTYRVNANAGRNTKVNIGKGLRARYFAFELTSSGQDFDLDTVEFIPLVVQRRV